MFVGFEIIGTVMYLQHGHDCGLRHVGIFGYWQIALFFISITLQRSLEICRVVIFHLECYGWMRLRGYDLQILALALA